jgi:hypothetical protein
VERGPRTCISGHNHLKIAMSDAVRPTPTDPRSPQATCLSPLTRARDDCRSEFLTDKPSTRVHAAPGGRQQFNIFGGADDTPATRAAPAQPPAAPAHAAGAPTPLDSQPTFGQRVEVRTEHTGISDRPSTFVHAPPGGRQQFNIFGGDEPVAPPKPAPVAQQGVPAAMNAVPAMAAGQRVAVRTEHTGISERPSTLVHAAPGGNSSMASLMGGMTAADRIAAMKAKREASVAAPTPLGEATNTGM